MCSPAAGWQWLACVLTGMSLGGAARLTQSSLKEYSWLKRTQASDGGMEPEMQMLTCHDRQNGVLTEVQGRTGELPRACSY